VNHWITVLAILASLSASRALGDDFTTLKGKEYKNAKVSRVEPDGVVLVYKSGVVKVYFAELPEEIQKRFGYDPAKADVERKSLEDRRIEEQKAAEWQRVEREKNAEADLKQAEAEFQAAQRRAAKTSQIAAKGTLSGQVFVSTRGAENFKLGAVQVALFARDAIDTLLREIKNYAGYKIQQQRPVAEAKAALDQAEAAIHEAEARVRATDTALSKLIVADGTGGTSDDTRRMIDVAHGVSQEARAAREARDAARATLDTAEKQHPEIHPDKLNFYYSGAFYFAFFQSPIFTAETDADGKFMIDVPQTGAFVIAAQAKRSTGTDIEEYYWLQPVTLEGHQQLTQNLSNNNLTSATETSSLIHTRIEHAISRQR
jgi:hypothetical protein